MRSPFVRGVISFLLPGGLLFAAIAYAADHRTPAFWLHAVGGIYALVAVVAALLLGWRFDRSRLVFATVAFGLGLWLLNYAGHRFDDLSWIIPKAVAVLLPLNIALVALAKERGILTWHGLLRWAVIGVQPLAVWALVHFHNYSWLDLFDGQPLPPQLLPALRLEQPALLAFAVALLVIGYRCLRHRNPMENGLFWAVAVSGYGLLHPPFPDLTKAFFATAVLILIVAVIETSYSMAYRDELTGLPARRALNEALLKLGGRYTIAMLDVDHFKKFNDTYGHDIGDQVLKMVAACMAGVRGGGKPFRYGGEEFTVIFPGKDCDETLPHLERLREAIADSGFTVRGPDRPRKKGDKPGKGAISAVKITISIGAAERDEEQRDPHEVIKAADKALYLAKAAGRNCVATNSGTPLPTRARQTA